MVTIAALRQSESWYCQRLRERECVALNDAGNRGIANDVESRGIASDAENRGTANDAESRGIANGAENRGIANDEESRGIVNDAERKCVVLNGAEVEEDRNREDAAERNSVSVCF
ncbi:unnamed protein product [Clonostachys rosea]|uniref:Uncharacterized protein n=1 Tax=Bionectria ochroleuca TaxID=29856 RepID=A0ABY6TXR6_BIOOC|nr:unnamed protein product [Clonostachys rosea]